MTEFYTEQEMNSAIEEAMVEIQERTEDIQDFLRGVNDCFALLVEYDEALRGRSKAKDLDLRYKSHLEFHRAIQTQKLPSIVRLATYCNYKLVKDGQARLGDVAYEGRSKRGSAMICWKNEENKLVWISVDEINHTGVIDKREVKQVEDGQITIFRPIRN